MAKIINFPVREQKPTIDEMIQDATHWIPSENPCNQYITVGKAYIIHINETIKNDPYSDNPDETWIEKEYYVFDDNGNQHFGLMGYNKGEFVKLV